MRKFGKYEKMRKNAILQTYITSLLCLVLCVTMFFGTSMAWFSDTAESTYNEMYVGTLEVELKHASFKNGELVLNDNKEMNAVEGDYKIFESGKKTETGIRWEPGYTAVEKFEVIEGEDSDLAFSYQMGINCDFVDTKNDNGEVTTSAAAKEKIAQAITVWNYLGDDAESIVELPKDFATMTAAGWEKVGTLYDVITNHLPVFEGEMNKEAVTATKKVGEETVDDPAKAYHLIALHMDENFDGAITKDAEGKITASVQGQTLNNITIKLVATQKHSEQDAFDNTYDAAANKFAVVSTADELKTALAAGSSIVLNEDIEMPNNERVDILENKAVVIDLNGHTLTSKDGGGSNTMAVYVNRGAKLTLTDTAGNGKIVSSCYGIYVQPGATFIMNGGTIDVSGNGAYDIDVIVWNGKFVMNAGTLNGRYGVWTTDYWKNNGESNAPACEVVIADNCSVNGSEFDIDITEAPNTILDVPADLDVNKPTANP